MYVEEDGSSVPVGDAPLENSCDVALVQFAVDDGVRVRVAPDLPGLHLFIRKFSIGDVVHEGLCPGWHFSNDEDAPIFRLMDVEGPSGWRTRDSSPRAA